MRDDDGDLGALFRSEADGLYRFAKRLLGDAAEAEDAVQDAFLRLTRRGDRPGDFVSPKAWVFRIVRNICIDRRRHKARRATVFGDDGVESVERADPIAASPETSALEADALSRVGVAMARLPAGEAEALNLVAVEGLSYREAAEVADVPVGTVRSRLHRARATLRAALSEQKPAASARGGGEVVPLRRRTP